MENGFTQELLFLLCCWVELLVFELSLKYSHFAEVHSHVCCEDCTYHLFSDALVIVDFKVLEDIVLLILYDLKRGCDVEVLEHT